MQVYQKIATLSLRHSYYKDGYCQSLLVRPIGQTQAMLERYGMGWRRVHAGFCELILSHPRPVELLSYLAPEYHYFEFSLHLEDEVFFRVTELPLNWLGQLFFETDASSDANENPIRLPQQLMEGNRNGRVGTIRIGLPDLLRSLPTGKPVNYEISWQARSSQWQYFVINRSRMPTKGLQIRSSGDHRFANGKQVVLPNEEEALLFVSEGDPIPLRQAPPYQFDLVKYTSHSFEKGNTASREQVIYQGLPFPHHESIGIVREPDRSLMTSPMFVYI